MRCPHCAGQIPDRSRFCGICGRKIPADAAAADETSADTPAAAVRDSPSLSGGGSMSLFELPVSKGARLASAYARARRNRQPRNRQPRNHRRRSRRRRSRRQAHRPMPVAVPGPGGIPGRAQEPGRRPRPRAPMRERHRLALLPRRSMPAYPPRRPAVPAKRRLPCWRTESPSWWTGSGASSSAATDRLPK